MSRNQGIILDCMWDRCPKTYKGVMNCTCRVCEHNPLYNPSQMPKRSGTDDRQPSPGKQLCAHPDASHGDFQAKYSAQLEADIVKFNQILQETGEELCIVCGKKITAWKKFLRLFWGPTGCSISFVYKYCCSHKCWGMRMPL